MVISDDVISKSNIEQEHEDEEMLFLTCELYPGQIPDQAAGKRRVRRRRKKAKAGGGESGKHRLTDDQVKFLEMSFAEETRLDCKRKVHLSAELGLEPKQVAVWFQNRRARHKSKQVEAAYLELKSVHKSTIIEKCHLEKVVFNLKEKLSEANEKIKKLSLIMNGAAGGTAGGSEMIGSQSSSTLTIQPLEADFGVVDNEAELIYISEYEFNNYIWSGYD
ncbi:hypothetical protein Cni_G20421 [Canna indica]|uniref:Homeobox-leucine zipper protein n=1 Tax=Canna indica TaxID=4628 RepID=A0AAQ3KTR7_9LILI|nr:hypothetical protein Cni_G20421 [Canna indica]